MKTGNMPRRAEGTKCLRAMPRLWLAMELLAVVLLGGYLGWWNVQLAADTASYVETSRMPLREALMSSRTLGYPAVLRVVACFSPEYGAIPWLHFAALAGTVFFFDFALRRFGCSPWLAFAVSSGLLAAALPLRSPVAFILSDVLAMLAATVAIAGTFWLAARPRQPMAWIIVVCAVAAAYHIRPAYLFLVPLVPCLSVLFRKLHQKSLGRSAAWRSIAAGCIAGCCLPLLAYCTLRAIAVRQFGLVSFSGYSQVGLAAELLQPDMLPRLSPKYQTLAREILEQRASRDMRPALPSGLTVDLRTYEAQYSVNIFRIAVPAARRLYGGDSSAINQALAEFSREVVVQRKGKYILWALTTYARIAFKIAAFQWSLWILAPVLVTLVLVRRFRQRRQGSPLMVIFHAGDRRTLIALAWLAPVYFIAAVGVLCLSGSYTDSRLVVPAGVFVPPLLALLVVREAMAIRWLRHGVDHCHGI